MKSEMHSLLGWALSLALLLTGCGSGTGEASSGSPASQPEKERLIRILADDREIIFQLNGSPAAQSLYDQLPLILPVENYGGNEKIFYPPRELDVSDTPLAQGPAGTLAYYAPWGDVAIFYGQCGGASGLYALGEAVSGADQIAALDGEIRMERVTATGVFPSAASAAASYAGEPSATAVAEEDNVQKLDILIGSKRFSALLYDNEAARTLRAQLPMTLRMSELNGNEKYTDLDFSLPAAVTWPSGILAGDLMLYGGSCLVLFYESFSTSYSYTPLGRIEDPAGLAEALGSGSVAVTFQLRQPENP